MNITQLVIRAKYGHMYYHPKVEFIGVGDEVWLNTDKAGNLVSISKIEGDVNREFVANTEVEEHTIDYGELYHRDSLGSVEVPFGSNEVWIIN